ncbi:protein kinase [bacterium]|nr:protein kinase [bacterium]
MQGQTIGGFRIIRELGRGGMGIVYEAEQALPRRHVALKVLPPEFAHSPGVAARFEQEANRMAQLDGHPNIATVYAAGEDNGTAYFAMQLLTGGDLEQRLARQGRFDQREAAQIIAKVAEALDHAHRQGIVHRDVKPPNIMFNAQSEPVVTDFGIAQAADQVRMTMTGMSVCTPEYASPEQVRGNPVDGRSDLYSLGVVLYRMVTGRPLFDGGNAITVATKHISEAPQSPVLWFPGLNGQLQHIIAKCLMKEPSARFGTGADLAQALRGIDWAGPAGTTSDWALDWGMPTAPPPHGSVPGPTVDVPKMAPPAQPRKGPAWPYVVGSIGLAGLIVGIVLMGGGPPGCQKTISGATVPSVLGMSFESAKATLWNRGHLDIQLGEDRHDETYPAGAVCSQHPPAGTKVERGDAIRVVVSKGPPPITVPGIIGMSAGRATETLAQMGLQMQVTGNSSDAPYPTGTVCSQSPTTGTQVERGDVIRVVMSKREVDDSALRAAIANWLDAWQRRDIDAYMACYASDCSIKRTGKPSQGWGTLRAKMASKFAENSFIAISSREPSIEMGDNTAEVSAWQEYNSSTWHDSGTKYLTFVLRDGRWLILRENFAMSSGGKGPR